jgi:hypothetical protein
LEIRGQGQGRRHAPDEHGFEENPRNHIVDVIDPRDMDGPTEHIAEQQKNDRWLYERHEEQLGGTDDTKEIPLGDALHVAHGEPEREGRRTHRRSLYG